MEKQNSTFESNGILQEVLKGLSLCQKTIPPKFLYDQKGSEIFEKICELEEYYPTRAETAILKDHAPEMANLMGEGASIIEPGSGASEKIKILVPHLKDPFCYVPIEISEEILFRASIMLKRKFKNLSVLPVKADFTQDFQLPKELDSSFGKKIIFFPGSTIGNFYPQEAQSFLKRLANLLRKGDGLLIGADMKKKEEILNRAYDDSQGVTAAFNLNLLQRLNREAGAYFKLSNFRHEAFYNERLGRVEMHLKSKVNQEVRVHQSTFKFHKGETIHTENSYKYLPDEFCELCRQADFQLNKLWMDKDNLFCVYYFEKMAG